MVEENLGGQLLGQKISLITHLSQLEIEFEKFAEEKRLLIQNHRKVVQEIREGFSKMAESLQAKQKFLVNSADLEANLQRIFLNSDTGHQEDDQDMVSAVVVVSLGLEDFIFFHQDFFVFEDFIR